MASRSASPSITQFFKAQRKRPRTGKDDGIVSASKKLLLEEGIISDGGAESSDAPPSNPVIEKLVKSEKSEVVTEKKKKKATTSKKSGKSKGCSTPVVAGETKISAFVKSTAVSKEIVAQSKDEAKSEENTPKSEENTPKSEDHVEPPVEKQNVEEEVVSDKVPSDNIPPPAVEESTEIVLEIDTSSSSKAARSPKIGNEPSTSKSTESPVKFLKLGSLSPNKKKKLTTEQVAKLLKKKNKLSDLKTALEGINQCAQKISEFRRTVAHANAKLSPAPKNVQAERSLLSSATKNLAEVPPNNFYSPSDQEKLQSDLRRVSASKIPASPSKLLNMNNKVKKRLFEEQPDNVKDGDKNLPAYQRFHNLAQKTPIEGGKSVTDELDLPLPYNFKVLKELFISVETVVGIMKSRKETIVFPKVKSGVQELFRKITLREKHLAQMVAVLPGCYKFGLEKVGLETHIKIDVEDLLPSVVCARRKAFHSALIKICLDHHKKFLLSMVPPIVVPSDKQITRWHPRFKIDEIPDIITNEGALPVKPAPEKISSARDVIAKAQNMLENANPRMKQAMKNMLINAESNGEQKPETAVTVPKPKSADTVKSIKGISQSLLEKIRNREKEKLLNEMTRSPAESKKLRMIKRLPNFVKVIRNMIVAEKKVALPMDIVTDRVSHSIQSMSAGETDAHIRLLVTLLPHWIKIHKLSNSDAEYLKIDKSTDINQLMQELDEIIKKHAS